MLATSVLNAPDLTPQLRIGCLLLFFNEVNGVQIGSLAGYEAFRSIARVNLVRGLAGLPIGIAGARLYGVSGAVVAMVVVAAIGMLAGHLAPRARGAPLGHPDYDFRGAAGDLGTLALLSAGVSR